MDKLIIADGQDPDQHYATGLHLSSPFITLCRGKKRYVAAGGFEAKQATARWPTTPFAALGKTRIEIVKAFCKKYRVTKPFMPARTAASIYRMIPHAELVENIFPERALKRPDEIRSIRAVQRGTEHAIQTVRDMLARAKSRRGRAHVGARLLTSEHLKRAAAIALAEHDCACPEMIISSGKQTAMPHHRGTGAIREGPVVVDIFPRSHTTQYFSDCTRTYVFGEAPKSFHDRYAAVLAAHNAARRALAKADAEKAARDVFAARGYATDLLKSRGFIHRLGHGVGLEIHEEPRLNAPVKDGAVITLEPGLYYDYGIRVEDIGVMRGGTFLNFVKLDKNPYL